MDTNLRPSFSVIDAELKVQFETFIDEQRQALRATLDGLTDAQARARLVPSDTTLLGLVKHATFVERVWFDQAITHRTRAEMGLTGGPEESFLLADDDTIASVVHAYDDACAASRQATAALGLDDLLTGTRFGQLPLRWVYLHVLRELAQHCGHADILREQLVSAP
jgi:Protein of unknown function (DUF664)